MGRLSVLRLLKLRFPERAEKELFSSILRGEVEVNGSPILKPGTLVTEDAAIDIHPSQRRFVSRGGEKLHHALSLWGHEARGKVFIDAGCSTGGFTDCLLRLGASLVYAVDVGYNLLDWRIRADRRVIVRERTNIMNLPSSALEPAPHQSVADLSFRSLRRAAAHLLSLTSEGLGVFLVKPQFEWKDPPAGFHGVVGEPDQVRKILLSLLHGLRGEGVHPLKAVASPIRGRKGNREYLFLMSNHETSADPEKLIEGLVLEREPGER